MIGKYTPEQAARVRAAIDRYMPSATGRGSGRRHPAEVTADRLAEALDKWPDAFDGESRDAVAYLRHVLQEIAEGKR